MSKPLKSQKLSFYGDEISQIIAMCFIVLEDCRGTATGHQIHIGKKVVEDFLQRALKATGDVP